MVLMSPSRPAVLSRRCAHRLEQRAAPARSNRSPSETISGNQCQSVAISGCTCTLELVAIRDHQWQSVAISGNQWLHLHARIGRNQWQSVASSGIRGNERQSVAISGHQWQSETISGEQWQSEAPHRSAVQAPLIR